MKVKIILLVFIASLTFGQYTGTDLNHATRGWVKSRSAVNVKDYGAVGDGVTDSYSYIQDALNAGENVFMPEGDYYITQPLKLHNNYLIGHNTKITQADTSTQYIIQLLGNVDSDFVYIEGIHFYGNGTISLFKRNYTDAGATGTLLYNITIKNCIFENTGTYALNLESPQYCNIENNIFKNGNGSYIRIHSGNRNTVKGNKFYNIKNYGITIDSRNNIIESNYFVDIDESNSSGVYLTYDGSIDAYGNIISKNHFLGVDSSGTYGIIDVGSSVNTKNIILNNYFKDLNYGCSGAFYDGIIGSNQFENVGQSVTGGLTRSRINDNQFISSDRALNCSAGNSIDFSNNTLTNCLGGSVRLTNSSNSTIKNNSFIDQGGTYGILLSGTSAHNKIEKNYSINDGLTNFIQESAPSDSNVYFSNSSLTSTNIYSITGANSVIDLQMENTFFATDSSNINDIIEINSTEIKLNKNLNMTGTSPKIGLGTYGQYIQAYSSSPNRGIKYYAAPTGSGWHGTHDFYTGLSGSNAIALRIDDNEINAYFPLQMNGTQVLTTRQTGFTTITGTGAKDGSPLNTATITATDGNIQSLTALVKALMDAMITHGLIGN